MDDCRNDISELPPSCSTLMGLLRSRALQQPEQGAYTFLPDGETEPVSWTYQELDRQSRAIAAGLQSLNMSGERALLLYPPGLDYLAAFFGCLYAGVVAVPAYPPRNSRNTPRIGAILADAGAAVALTTAAIQPKIQSLLSEIGGTGELQWLATDSLNSAMAATWREPSIEPDTLAFLQYTSGSTGTPKGVMLSHGNLLHNAAMTYRLMEHSPASQFVSWLPVYHDMGLIGGILQPLYGGFPCTFMSPASFLQRPYRWLQTISRYRGTTSGGPNFAYELCVEKITPAQRETLDLSSWSVAFNGAEPVRQDTLERFAAAFAPCGFRKEAFYPCYGLAEATLMVSGSRKTEKPVVKTLQEAALERNQAIPACNGTENSRTLVGCGQPLPDQKTVIVHPETLTRCAPGEIGEIWVSGSSVGHGYWNRSEETAQTFRAYLADTGEGPFLRTGDLGFLQGGELFLTGRAKDLIIIRGRNLYPQDIELTAERSHPALRAGSGAAFSVEVGGSERLVVVQEVEFRQKPNVEEVIAAIRQAVAEEHEVQVYAAVLLKAGTIPKTSSGKIQRRATRAEWIAGTLDALGSSTLNSDAPGEAQKNLSRETLLAISPETRQPVLESYLQELVRRVLELEQFPEIHQPLSRFGLDSLKVIELRNRIELDLGVAVPVADFFEGASVAQLAAEILSQLAGVTALPAIEPVGRNSNLPLSFAQERLWFFDQLQPASPLYNLCAQLRLAGRLNAAALSHSLNEIIRRHETLRTNFATEGGKPVQVIAPARPFNLPVTDLSELSESEREAELHRLSAEEARSPFDLAKDSLLRAKLLRLAEAEHVLLVSAHHIVFDGWSVSVFLRELAEVYQAFDTGNLPLLPALPAGCADFAVWQKQALQGILETQLAYWKQQLGGDLPVLNLPADFPRPAVQTFQGARMTFELPKHLSEAIAELSRQEGTTLFMTLLAAFKTLLYRYTGQEDILVGSPAANRNRAEIEGLIGFFVNTLVLRTDLTGNPTFRELLRRVRQVALGAYAHQDLPFEKLVEELQPERDLSHSPLFQVAFALHARNRVSETALASQPESLFRNPVSLISLQEVDTGTAKFDLTLFLEETERGLMGTWEYSTDLFQSGTIARLTGHLQTLLEGIAANPEQRLSEVPVLTEAEKRQLLVEWPETGFLQETRFLVHQLFEAQVERTPDAVAAVFEGQQLTYRQLNQRANQLARHLQQLGVKPEVLVGICAERSLEMLVGLLGILKAGGAYVPLDPAYPKERLAFMLEETQVPVLLAQAHLAESLPPHQARLVCPDSEWETIAQQSEENLAPAVAPENLAYVMYTSGSTGKPKGVCVTHRGVVRLVKEANYASLTAEEVFLQLAPISFDASTFEIWGSLLNGARLAVMPPGTPSLQELGQAIRQHQVTVLWLTAGLFHLMVDEQLEDLKQVRQLLAGGDVLSVPHVLKLLREAKGCRLVNGYGPTENTTFTCCYSISDASQAGSSVPIGRPVSNTCVYILDSHLQPVPVGVPGELYIGGDGLARGYFNRPDLTAEKFIPNPFVDSRGAGEMAIPDAQPPMPNAISPIQNPKSKIQNPKSDRLYKTGDLVRYRSDGNIEFLSRTDSQVKIRGFRIELGEIEAVLNQHPHVRESAVSVREDTPGDKRIVAYIVPDEQLIQSPNPQIPASQSELRSFLQQRLPEYMVPSTFAVLEKLPLTPNGKVDRRALPAPDAERLELSAGYAAPRTPEEQLLAEIWAGVLAVKQVGIHDNFFELGGHSLLAAQLIAKLPETFRVNLPLRSLFQSPTVASLAVAIAQAKPEQREQHILPAIVPDPQNRHKPFPLNEMQQAYWIGRNSFFEMGNVAIHGYVEVESDNLDVARFARAWQRLVERHDMLRAVVTPDGQQQILERVPVYDIEVLDLRGQSPEAVSSQLLAIRDRLSHQVLPLEQWPLFEIRASKLDGGRTRLHISIDALCVDGWSYQILFRDLAELYRNPDAALPPLQLSFRDYVLATLALQDSAAFQQSLEYWLRRVATLPPAPELPLAQHPSALRGPKFKRWSYQIEPATWKKLKTRAGRAGLSPTGLLLAAYAEVLALWSKSPRFTLNVPRFNRLPLHPEVNDLIGEFASFTLLEVDNSQREAFEVRAQRLQQQLWQDLEHQYVSGVRVLRELGKVQGRAAGAPMPVVFTTNPQNTPGQSDSSIVALIEEFGEVGYIAGQTPQVWIDSQYSEAGGTLFLNWDAVEELFPQGLIGDMFDAYCRLLQRLAGEEGAWRETARQLLPPAQLQQRAAVNATEGPIPEGLLHTLFAGQVPQRPQQAAVIAPNRTLSYEELYRLSNQVGHRLRREGARPNQLVAVVMEKGCSQIVAVLGVLASGAAYLPVDPRLPKERFWYVLENSQVEVVLTESRLNESLEWPAGLRRICLDTGELAGESDQPLEPAQQPEDLAYVIYTSGSTGSPKGVAIAHRGAVNAVAHTNETFKVGPSDRVLAVTALYHDMSVYDIFGLLAAGGTIVMPAAESCLDPAHWAELMVRERVTLWNSVPPMMEMLLDFAGERPDVLPDGLRWAFLGGDWIPLTLPDRLRALVPGVRAVSVGGPTETTLWNIWYPVETADPTWKSVPYGKPIANTRYYILNETLEDCPVWVAGQMYCAGVGLTKGYWRNEEKTRESFATHPVTGERLYKTGDLGRYLPDGNIEFLGREDFRLKIRGYRIEAGEIEAALGQHPAVRATVVTAAGGQHSDRYLVAYIVPAQETAPTPEELRQFLSQKLPEYMVPSVFVMLAALPLSANGKVDRRALPAPDTAVAQRADKTFVAPDTPLEKVLAGIWAEVLEVESVGICDDFFCNLGGNSLLATRVLSGVRDTFGVEVPMRCFFEAPTVAGLAGAILQKPDERVKVENTAQLLLSVAELSDEEVERMLEEKFALTANEESRIFANSPK